MDSDVIEPAGSAALAPTFHIVRIVSVEVALPEQFPVVTLEDEEEEDPRPTITLRVGTAEGVALAHALAGSAPPRPLTHDLFAVAMERFGIDVLSVRLIGRVGTTYIAELELVGASGREVLSCRPSDGMCLALRRGVPAPILADERLFQEDGDVVPDT